MILYLEAIFSNFHPAFRREKKKRLQFPDRRRFFLRSALMVQGFMETL